MAKKDDEGTAAVAPAVPLDMHAFAQVLAQAMAQAQSIYQPRELKEGDPEYVAMQKAEGWYDAFERPVYQNGKEANPRGIPADIRHKAANLRSGGPYIKGRVRVEASEKGVHLFYPTKNDAMMINQMQYFSSFEDLIEKIWHEQNAPVPA